MGQGQQQVGSERHGRHQRLGPLPVDKGNMRTYTAREPVRASGKPGRIENRLGWLACCRFDVIRVEAH